VGCVSFPKRAITEQYLDGGHISDLNGKYENECMYSVPTKDMTSPWNFSSADLGIYPTFFDEIDNRWLKRSIKIDTLKQYAFSLNVITPKMLAVHLLENDSIIRKKWIRFRLGKDGYLYLKNTNFKIRGIPYVFGDIDKKRIRLTLTEDNNLLFETSEFNSGGLFLLMINPYTKMKYEKIFRRIE
jgi:hypothetical protein